MFRSERSRSYRFRSSRFKLNRFRFIALPFLLLGVALAAGAGQEEEPDALARTWSKTTNLDRWPDYQHRPFHR